MNRNDLENSAWYSELWSDIEEALRELSGDDSNRPSRLKMELQSLRGQIAGWKTSLGDPKLPDTVRDEIHVDFERGLEREREIEVELQRLQNREDYLEQILDPEVVLQNLDRLDDILGSNNATLGNLELSLHIDRIDCFDDGRVILRLCRLGGLSDCVELFQAGDCPSESETVNENFQQSVNSVKPRRRAKLRVPSIGSDAADLDTAAEFVAAPDRFAGLEKKWFEEIEFRVPTEKHWYQIHADEVAQRRLEGLTHQELADEFGVTIPTIRKALKYASDKHPELAQLPRKMPRARWHETHAGEVAAKKAEGMGTNELVKFFGKSDTTIRKALEHAKNNLPQERGEQSE